MQGLGGCVPLLRSIRPPPLAPRRPSTWILPHGRHRARCYIRPSIAPKPVLDIRSIVKSPGLYEQNCLDRNYENQAQNSWKIHALTERRTELQRTAREKREENNGLQKLIGELQRDVKAAVGEEASVLLEKALQKAKGLKDNLSRFSEEEKQIEEDILELALALPNLSSHCTPNGNDFEVVEIVEPESSNLKYHTDPKQCLNKNFKSHVDIGAQLDLLDFAAAAKSSGWGWYYLKNDAAMLEQALVQFALSVLRKKNFTIVSPPSIVYSHIAAACGFQPRDQHDEQQIYALQQAEKDISKPPLSLAATAEIPLAGMFSGHTFSEKDLPLRMGAASRCYRAEAGARGVDTKGLYRVHEFTKVEMFAWTMPPIVDEDGFFDTQAERPTPDIFEEMLDIQKEILTSLGLTYRVLEMPASDLGGPATRKRDIEVFFPSRQDKDEGWGEVTSTSICTDYQSRRLGTRVKSQADGKATWPYTFNGTALAVPRVLAAIMETHYDHVRQSINIPTVLRRWVDMDEIKR